LRYRVIKMRARGLMALGLLAVVLIAGVRWAGKTVAAMAGERLLPIYSVETPEKKVALGFNCAWDNADIPQLIEILEKHQIKTTFFVSGSWCKKFPESVKALYDAGHEIGSHSNTHTDMVTLDRDGLLREIDLCNEKIANITGQAPTLFRMPSGSYNDLVIETIRSRGMIPIQWDCDSLDYRNPTPDAMRERIMGKLQNGSILLFHSGAQNTPTALPDILQAIDDAGSEIVPVSALILPEPYPIDHEGRQHPA
jgi:peptidoglycan/xylan/chitin deacetylase (PgdA/CDA1 family)